MRDRRFGRLGWSVGEVGYGMWGMGAWTGSDDEESRSSLREAVRLGCTFFDTAWVYGKGRSERLLGALVRDHPEIRLFTASKIPPKNLEWPSRRGATLEEVFPPDHIRRFTEKTLENLGLSRVDLMQFHVWEDAWANDGRWLREIESLKREGMIGGVGISINRWEPWNALETLRTGLIDAVQVVYNVFDQGAEDELLPLCRALDIAVIARVPLDEGALTGTLTPESRWPEGDWRNGYFTRERLEQAVKRVERLRPEIPAGMDIPEMALRFVLSNPAVSTVIPGMRKITHVRSNLAVGDGAGLPARTIARLRAHRWDRELPITQRRSTT